MSSSSSTDYLTEEEGSARSFSIIELLDKLGSGQFSEVWKVKCRNGSIQAAKIFYAKHEIVNKVLQLKRFLFKLKHDNVLNFLCHVTYDGKPVLITEFINGINLRQLRKQRIIFDYELRFYIRQICRGLEYLHSRNPVVIHGNLNGGNVMVENYDTQCGKVKLIDFDQMHLLKECPHSGYMEVQQGAMGYVSLRFAAPEILNMASLRTSSDICALGCTVYEMLAGEPPYADLTRGAITERLNADGAPQLNFRELKGISDAYMLTNLENFYKCCVAKNPSNRKSATQLLQHPFIW